MTYLDGELSAVAVDVIEGSARIAVAFAVPQSTNVRLSCSGLHGSALDR